MVESLNSRIESNKEEEEKGCRDRTLRVVLDLSFWVYKSEITPFESTLPFKLASLST